MIDYFFAGYDDKGRWVSYWHQIKEALEFNPKKVLVIGKGNGIVPEYFRLAGIKTVVLDIDETLKPDIIASVLKMPFAENEFDVVLCAEVLEHLPFENFNAALLEIKRVTGNNVVISLPHFGPAIKFLLKLPFLPEIRFIIKLPYPKKHQFKGEHYWEIGKSEYSLNKIRFNIKKSGLAILKDYIVFENPIHRFFILKK